MTAYVALLRAVNVGGRKLAMADLTTIADELGLERARTYIASGNLLFASSMSEKAAAEVLEAELSKHMRADVPVLVRNAREMAKVVAENPFNGEPPNKVVAIFLADAPPKDALAQARNVTDERVALGKREIYVHYPSGQGRSKLKIPAAANGTARNMNTVAKLAQLAGEYE